MSDPIAVLNPSTARRYFAVGVLGVTAALTLWVALATPPASLGWRLYLIGFSGVAIWLTLRLWQATAVSLVLTDDGIFDSAGACLCRMDDIKEIERGMFAFKPSNGFLVRLRAPGRRGWAPGLWWRFGRRIGVGGVTPASQGKFMAEMLALKLHERDGDAI